MTDAELQAIRERIAGAVIPENERATPDTTLYQDVAEQVVLRDTPALLAEVDRLRKENAGLIEELNFERKPDWVKEDARRD